MSAPFALVPLTAEHDKSGFESTSDVLNQYFREQVSQDIRRRVAACFVALAKDGSIAGCYTLASASVLLDKLPLETRKKLPRYPSVPAVRMGRLAVSKDFQKKGLVAHCSPTLWFAPHVPKLRPTPCWSMPKTRALVIFIVTMALLRCQMPRSRCFCRLLR